MSNAKHERGSVQPPAGGAPVSMAFMGTVVPDRPEFHSAAFSRAGNLYQERFLEALAKRGANPDLVVSARLLPSFPASKKLWVKGGSVTLGSGVVVTLVPYVNVTPLKQMTIGLGSLLHIALWALRSRGSKRVVYSYNLTVPPGLLLLLGARLCRAKMVVALCDINVPGETVPAGLWQACDYWIQRKLIPRLDGVVAITDALVRDFAPRVPFIRMEGGITSELVSARAAPERSGDEFVIAFAGTLNAANGVEILLEGFRRLTRAGYRLRVAGAGPLEARVREAAAADARIEFLGLIPYAEVLTLYSSSDVLVNMRLTKEVDTRYFFPSKMMEYLASGVPVVTTPASHIEEEYGRFVYLVHDETPEGLATVLESVRGESLDSRRERAAHAREFVKTFKTWDAQTSRVLAFLKHL